MWTPGTDYGQTLGSAKFTWVTSHFIPPLFSFQLKNRKAIRIRSQVIHEEHLLLNWRSKPHIANQTHTQRVIPANTFQETCYGGKKREEKSALTVLSFDQLELASMK